MNSKVPLSIAGALGGILIIAKLVKIFKYGGVEGFGTMLVVFLLLGLLFPIGFLFSYWLGDTLGARWVQSGDTALIRHKRQKWAERGGCLLTVVLVLVALMIFCATR